MYAFSKNFIRLHQANYAIALFLILFAMIHITKPGLLYTEQGGFRPFGLGYRNKTVLPIWIAAIVLAIFSYLAVLVYVQYM